MMGERILLERFGPPRPDDEGAQEAGVNMPAELHEGGGVAGLQEAEIDPEVEKTASLARIAGALEIIAAEQAGLRARCIGDTASALGAAAETLLPRVARDGFAALVAETAQTIARRGQWPELVLSVAPDNAAAVEAALCETGAGTDVKVTAEPALGPDEAQLGWADGGAEIDIEAIAEAALERFRHQLDTSQQRGA